MPAGGSDAESDQHVRPGQAHPRRCANFPVIRLDAMKDGAGELAGAGDADSEADIRHKPM